MSNPKCNVGSHVISGTSSKDGNQCVNLKWISTSKVFFSNILIDYGCAGKII